MKYKRGIYGLVILLISLASMGYAEDYNVQYFLGKASSKVTGLSNKERTELLNRMEGVIEQAQRIHKNLTKAIQTGEMDIQYQEGEFWMSKLEGDQGSIEMGMQQLKLLKAKPTNLVASIKLYKSLKDLSSNFNTYNNMPSFSAFVGDLAPEMELWADPIFYKLYLLPLASIKDTETKPPQKEKATKPKSKAPAQKEKKS